MSRPSPGPGLDNHWARPKAVGSQLYGPPILTPAVDDAVVLLPPFELGMTSTGSDGITMQLADDDNIIDSEFPTSFVNDVGS
jgi:hypothetical protein